MPEGATFQCTANFGQLANVSLQISASGTDVIPSETLANGSPFTLPLQAGEVYVILWYCTTQAANYGMSGNAAITVEVLNPDKTVNGTTFNASYGSANGTYFGFLLVSVAGAASSSSAGNRTSNDAYSGMQLQVWNGAENASTVSMNSTITGGFKVSVAAYSSGGDGEWNLPAVKKLWAGNAYVLVASPATDLSSGNATINVSMADREGNALGSAVDVGVPIERSPRFVSHRSNHHGTDDFIVTSAVTAPE